MSKRLQTIEDLHHGKCKVTWHEGERDLAFLEMCDMGMVQDEVRYWVWETAKTGGKFIRHIASAKTIEG